MLTYLEGARYKLQSALLELDHKQRGSHPLAPHIQITRDRTGLQQSILKVPLWLKNNEDNETENGRCFSKNENNNDNLTDIDDDDDEHNNHHNVDEIDLQPTNQSKNDVLINKFSNGFQRSKSNIDFTPNSTLDIPISEKSNTLSDNSNATDSPIFDRGIADGVSNQPDSDFGMILI